MEMDLQKYSANIMITGAPEKINKLLGKYNIDSKGYKTLFIYYDKEKCAIGFDETLNHTIVENDLNLTKKLLEEASRISSEIIVNKNTNITKYKL